MRATPWGRGVGSHPLLAASLVLGLLARAEADAPVYFGLQPGRSSKAVVDLELGQGRKLETNVYQYPPPRGDAESRRVVATFFPEDQILARLDVYLKTPLPAEALREQFGTSVVTRPRASGGAEELFFPKLHGLVFADAASTAPAAAISFLSPRLLADFYVDRFDEHFNNKRYEEARTEADKAVMVDPEYTRGYLAQGLCAHYGTHDYDEAVDRYTAAVNAKGSTYHRWRAHVERGEIFWRQKKWLDQAAADFQQAIALRSDLDAAYLGYAGVLQAQDRRPAAEDLLSKALERDPDRVDLRLELAWLYNNSREHDKALVHCQILSRWADSPAGAKEPARKRARCHYCYAYMSVEGKDPSRKERRQAIALLEKTLAVDPQMTVAYASLCHQYRELDDLDKAFESCRQGLSLDPRDFSLNQNLGRALLRDGKEKGALRQAELTLSLKPDDSIAMMDIARCWGALHRKKEALLWVKKAVAAGYQWRASLIDDPNLKVLRGNREFKRILERLR